MMPYRGVGAANQYLHCDFGVRGHWQRGGNCCPQYLGSKRYMEASKISALAVTLNLGVGLVISAGFLLFSRYMMEAMNLQGDVLMYAQSYLSIVGGAIFLQAIINSLAAIIRVHGFTKQAMFVSLGMNIFHIAGNYALIFREVRLSGNGRAGSSNFICVQPICGADCILLAAVSSDGIQSEISILHYAFKRIYR